MEEALGFSSGPVRLEGRLAYRDDLVAPRGSVLLCPPHPFLGGDMDNNVLTALTQALVERGFVVYRYNYRGIGASETDRDLAEDQKLFWEHSTCPEYESRILVDSEAAFRALAAAVDAGEESSCVVGYSFGCLPAMRLLTRYRIARLALISPPLTKWQFDPRLLPAGIRKKFFHSIDDFACPPERLAALAAAAPGPVAVQTFRDADHFFIGQEQALADAVSDFLSEP